MLQRNLLYTAIPRGKRLVILVGEKRALDLAVQNSDSTRRYSGLKDKLGAALSRTAELPDLQ
jgi:exodeoxyribonuclease V alpha subunit